MTGAEFRAWRKERGLTQRQLAALIDMSLATIKVWENLDQLHLRDRLALAAIHANLSPLDGAKN